MKRHVPAAAGADRADPGGVRTRWLCAATGQSVTARCSCSKTPTTIHLTSEGHMTTSTSGSRRWRPVAGAATLTVLTLLVGAAVLASAGDRPPSATAETASASPRSAPSGAPSSVAPPDPAATLERLAAQTADEPADPPKARYEYIEIRVWESYPAKPSTPLGTGPGRHIRYWTTSQGASRSVVIDETRGCPPERDETDNDLGPFDGPLSGHPDALRRQILHEPLPPGTSADHFGQIAEFYSQRFVPFATRQGILRMLAQLPGVAVQPDVTDPLGRPGFAVTWTYQPPMPFTVAKTLTFSASGQLLTSHSRAHRRPNATTPPNPMDEYEIFMLVLTSTYTPTTAAPAATCP